MSINEDIMHALGRLEEGVSGAREDIREIKDATSKRLNGHAERLRGLEDSRAKGRGVLATVSLLAGAVGLERLAHYMGISG